MKLFLAHQQLNEATDQHVITFDSDPLGKPQSLALQLNQEEDIQLELPMESANPFFQDPLISEALRIFEAQVA
tara:strand:- start:287 stop:505 length:219 start_codon:yes stop_codon:yes gene_type:complete